MSSVDTNEWIVWTKHANKTSSDEVVTAQFNIIRPQYSVEEKMYAILPRKNHTFYVIFFYYAFSWLKTGTELDWNSSNFQLILHKHYLVWHYRDIENGIVFFYFDRMEVSRTRSLHLFKVSLKISNFSIENEKLKSTQTKLTFFLFLQPEIPLKMFGTFVNILLLSKVGWK